jgi:hypothetical protein
VGGVLLFSQGTKAAVRHHDAEAELGAKRNKKRKGKMHKELPVGATEGNNVDCTQCTTGTAWRTPASSLTKQPLVHSLSDAQLDTRAALNLSLPATPPVL